MPEELYCPFMCGLAIVIRDITNLIMGNPNVASAGNPENAGNPSQLSDSLYAGKMRV